MLNYRKYLRSEKWKKKAKRIKARDKNKCRLCKSTKRLEVHHLTYMNIGKEKDKDLITLCRRCHRIAHDMENKNKNMADAWAWVMCGAAVTAKILSGG